MKKTLTGLDAKKHILDPIHGPIPITSIELEIISKPVFQRLRQITQLSMASLVFPGATHNRFQHCLGTMHVMDKLLYSLILDGSLPQDNNIIQKMRISALVHDIGHLPFSHTFENTYENPEAHEYFGKCIIERSSIADVLTSNNIVPESISALITGHAPIKDTHMKELMELIPLLHSNADADRMDYLLRDAYFTGVPYGHIDINRICNFVSISNGRICFDEKAQDALEDFLFSRYQMYKIVYIHKTVIGYELILQKIYNELFLKYKNSIDLPFILPEMEIFENSTKEWYDNEFYDLNEGKFFNSIHLLLKSDIAEIDKKVLDNLFKRIKYRNPIQNCFRQDDLAEVEERDYCEKEGVFFDELKLQHPEIVNHWSFLRYNPVNPIKIASPIDKGIDDDQDPKQIRILKRKQENKTSIDLLQKKPNSFIQHIAKHHRVLICYYHDEKSAQEVIREKAVEKFNMR